MRLCICAYDFPACFTLAQLATNNDCPVLIEYLLCTADFTSCWGTDCLDYLYSQSIFDLLTKLSNTCSCSHRGRNIYEILPHPLPPSPPFHLIFTAKHIKQRHLIQGYTIIVLIFSMFSHFQFYLSHSKFITPLAQLSTPTPI